MPPASALKSCQRVQVWQQDFPGMSEVKLMSTVALFCLLNSSGVMQVGTFHNLYVHASICVYLMCLCVLWYTIHIRIHLESSKGIWDREATT